MSILVVFSGLPPEAPRLTTGGSGQRSQRRLNADSTPLDATKLDATQTQSQGGKLNLPPCRRNASQRRRKADATQTGAALRPTPKRNADATPRVARSACPPKRNASQRRPTPTERNPKRRTDRNVARGAPWGPREGGRRGGMGHNTPHWFESMSAATFRHSRLRPRALVAHNFNIGLRDS